MRILGGGKPVAVRRAGPVRRLRSRRAVGAFLIAVAAAVLWFPHPAQAAKVVATITGVTGSGTDSTGVFGFVPGSSMDGHSFKLVYTIDDTKGQQGILVFAGPGSGSYIENSGLNSPMTAILTINGHSVSYGTLPIDSVSSLFEKRLTNQGRGVFLYPTLLSETYNVGNSHGGGRVFVGFDGVRSLDYHWAAGIDVALGGAQNNQASFTHYDTDSTGKKYNYQSFFIRLVATRFEIPSPPPIAKNLGVPGKDCGCADGAPNCLAGNPINAAVGNKLEIETDFAGAASTGLTLTRYYNSRDTTRSAFGVGWRSAWHRSLDPVSANVAVVTRADGRQDTFNLAAGVWWPDPDVTSRLTAVTSAGKQTGWQLATDDDTTETYALDGRLTSVTTRAGLATTLAYNAAGQLTTVTGPFGHKLGFVENAAGRVVKMTAPDGGVFAYAYDGGGNLVSVTHPDGGVRRYVYGDASFPHALTGIVDENGAAFASWAYDAKGRAVSSQHAGGVELTKVAYNADGSSTVTDARGNAHSYALTTQFGMVKPTALTGAPYPAAGGKAFTYDANGFIASRTDFDGNVTTYEHDASGNETLRIEAAGTRLAREIVTTWLAKLHLPSEIRESGGRGTTFAYDAKGNLLTKTIAANFVAAISWSYTWNAKAQVLTATDPLGHVTRYSYDAKGDLATLTDPLGHVTKFTLYDADGRLLSMTDPNGLTTTLTYNFRGEVTSRDVGGELTTYTYDRAGQLTKTTRPDGSFLTFTHDAAHRLTGVRDALGNRAAYSRDAASNLVKVQLLDPTGTLTRVRSWTYDSANRVAKSIGAAGQATLYARDGNGNPTKATDPLGHAASYAYDALNRLAKATDPNGGVTADTYDALDHLTAVTDPRGLTTSYRWDGLDDQTAVRSPDSGATARTFDAAGNVLTSTDARGLKTTYTYDALDRPVSAAYADGKVVTWHYDQGTNGIGHLTAMTDRSGSTLWTYDRHGRVLTRKTIAAGMSFTTATAYDAAGRLASIAYPSGAVVAVSYDAAGRVSGLKAGATALASGVAYQPFGPAEGWTQGNGALYSRSFDQDGRIAKIAFGAGAMTLSYDKASRITGIAETGLAAKSFAYDAQGRLTGYTSGATALTYGYDANGNRTTLKAGATTTYDIVGWRVDGPVGARGGEKEFRCGAVAVVCPACLCGRSRWPGWVPRTPPKRMRDLDGRHPTRVVGIVGSTDRHLFLKSPAPRPRRLRRRSAVAGRSRRWSSWYTHALRPC